jgi:hypothetical protein
MTEKFSRKIKMTDHKIPYGTELNIDEIKTMTKSCHWGALKLLYSEIEFLVLASKYIDINECLVLYVGAQPGYRLKHLYMKHFFPKIHMLLYDPMPFDIPESDQIIIKTGPDGWFDDDKIEEVLSIANGRKILYISDIRLNDDDAYTKESLIHDDLQKQQAWGVMMKADFMLLKFRMFFYKTDPKEVDFINNNYMDKFADEVLYKKDENKHESIDKWFLHLKGSIFTQLFAPMRSTEARLFVKKIKYYKDANKYSKEDQEKYKMKYYNNIDYEEIFNYFNVKVKNNPIIYDKSDKMVQYIPGKEDSYTTASEYYIIKQYFKYYLKEKTTFKNILNKIVTLYTILNERYRNNLVICSNEKRLKKYKNSEKDNLNSAKVKKVILETLDEFIEICNKQFNKVKNSKLIDDTDKDKFIKSYQIKKNPFFYFKDNQLHKKDIQIE